MFSEKELVNMHRPNMHDNTIVDILTPEINMNTKRMKNAIEPKDVVKNWLRSKNTLEYLGLWEQLNNPNFKGVEFAPPF